jgi:PST family polysaccharide transporter
MSHKKTLISNFLSLSSVQFANYIFPLITVPYLVRVLGPERFGLISFSQAFIQYFILLTDYGFNLSATREISINREDLLKISEIFSSVMVIKILLMIVAFLVLCVVVLNVNKFRPERMLYFLSFGAVIGNVLFPIWIFQGMEKMKQIAVLNFLSKAIFTGFVFIFVKEKGDYIYVPVINALGYIVAGIVSLRIIFGVFNIKIKMPALIEIRHEVKEGWHIFMSTIAISLYTISNTFILGLFANNVVVGYFSGGEKIVKAVQGLLLPFSQTIYPHVSKLASESKEIALLFIRRIVRMVGVVTFCMSLCLFIFASYISDLILGTQFKSSIQVIQILSFLPFIVGLSNIFGIQVMLNFGLKKAFMKTLITASILNILLALLLVAHFKLIGITVSILITELFVTSSMLFVIYRKNLRVF